jgi:hypothetical protein
MTGQETYIFGRKNQKTIQERSLRNTVHLTDQIEKMTRQETSIFGRIFFVNGGLFNSVNLEGG